VVHIFPITKKKDLPMPESSGGGRIDTYELKLPAF